VLIPTESHRVRSGKKYTSERMFYPGYVLVEMDMDDHVWHVVKATPRVTGFVGHRPAAHPLFRRRGSAHCVSRGRIKDKPKLKVKFEKERAGAHHRRAFATLPE